MRNIRYSILMMLIIASCKPKGINDTAKKDSIHQAPVVWVNSTGEGRYKMVAFRNDLNLEQLPAKAEINIFADSRYHLHVNGHMVNFGPVRFYPENPFYDTYNIAPYLKKGDNVIAVKVLTNGMNTYQLPKSIGGFAAWGAVNNKDISTPGRWKCKIINGLDTLSPKMSFALGAIEIYDARKDSQNWDKPGIDLSCWKTPVKIKNQDNWAVMKPRIIPHLTQDEIIPEKLMGKYKIEKQEDIYFFRVLGPDQSRKEFQKQRRLFAYTYIYSPIPQKVKTGMWWGEFWLNGKGPIKGKEDKNIPNRINITFNLKQGWNFLFMKYGMVWGHWDFYMAVPNGSGLILSPDKDKASEFIFKTAGPFKDSEEESVKSLGLPFASPADLPANLSEGWVGQERGTLPANPAWNVAWSNLGEKDNIHPSQVKQLKADNPEGTAFVFDMGGKQLGRIFVEYDAPEGTVIDIGFAEDMKGKKPWVLKRAGIYTGSRFITSEDVYRLETFKPYGLRYMQLNVKSHGEGPVTIKKTGVVSQVYPFDKKGSFKCSDPMMNAIWELGWRTLLVCSEDTYTDTPFRERGTYAGDALPQYAITLATSGDSRLIKQSLEYFSNAYSELLFPENEKKHFVRGNPEGGGHLGDFPFHTLEYFRWYVEYTKDIDFALKLYSGYKNMCNSALKSTTEQGLIDHDRPFIEWTQIDRNATLTAMQALIARSFDNLAAIASMLGKEAEAKKHRDIADSIAAKTRKYCWDDKKNAFRDGFKNGKPIDSYYPISSAWPVNYDVSNEQQNNGLEDHFRKTLSDIGDKSRNRLATPYGSFYVLGALYKLGYEDIAEDFIRRYWSPMIFKYDDTAWENFDDGTDGGGQGTLSHAWSGGPTYYLSTRVLGVRLGYPDPVDYDKIVIAPQADNIEWAEGTVPHPKGLVKVSWKVDNDKLFLDYQLPESIECEVKPRGRLSELELWVNGKRMN